ncbi:MAG TPA: non-ribosomal peptide synthetase, partial [Thermoanaerobaculia bacterium]|nr:non-ribosomal peptide synthetase [Thermoanaerobaculia bacterium]
LDPEFPAERLAYMVADSGLRVLLTEERLLARFAPEPGVTLVVLDREGEEAAAAGPLAAVPPLPAGPGNIAYVIYTSGSTGWPKGVQIVHRGLANFHLAMSRRLGFTAGDALLAVATLSFDMSALDLYLPLVVGGRVVIASREVASDGERLAAVLMRPEITALQATPATWRMLLAAGWTGKPELMALCGGEALPRDLADRLLGAVSALWNVYGPTETTIYSTLDRVGAGGGPVSIGRPLANTRVLLLSGAAEPVPVGVVGELCLAGEGLARGYLGRPDLNAERFVPDPSPTGEGEPGGRLYRTGDLARRLSDGRLECLGRIDGQVKVRGFRIEPGEIELALAGHPAIRQAVVAARKMEDGELRLVAWFVAEATPSSVELRAFLASRLPDYMVPGMFVHLDELPLNPNGKVDRRALPEPRMIAGTADLAPRNPLEQVLADIWGEVLGIEGIGVGADFFDLGGHSLLAVQVVSRVRRALGVDLHLRQVFGSPTVAQLATTILESAEQRDRVERTAALVVQLNAMSEEQIEAMLKEETYGESL